RSPATRQGRLSTGTRTRSPTLPMSGLLPAISRREIRTGSWLEPAASTKARRARRRAAPLAAVAAALALVAIAVALSPTPPSATHAAHPPLAWPLEIDGSQYVPVAWADIPGWYEDDQLAAFAAL